MSDHSDTDGSGWRLAYVFAKRIVEIAYEDVCKARGLARNMPGDDAKELAEKLDAAAHTLLRAMDN